MTMNRYIMAGSSLTSNKPLMLFTGTDRNDLVENYLNVVRANLLLNIGPESSYTLLHQNWAHRHTALIQTNLDGAAHKRFSIFLIEVTSRWKQFTQESSKTFNFERNKTHQKFLCNEIRRLPKKLFKNLL